MVEPQTCLQPVWSSDGSFFSPCQTFLRWWHRVKIIWWSVYYAFMKGKRIFLMLEIHDYEKFQKVKPVEVGRPLSVTGNTEGWRSLSEFSSLQRLHTLTQCVFACVLTWITVCVYEYTVCVFVCVCVVLQPAALSQPTYSLMEPKCLGFLLLHVNLQCFSLVCWPSVTGPPSAHRVSHILCAWVCVCAWQFVLNLKPGYWGPNYRRATLLHLPAVAD